MFVTIHFETCYHTTSQLLNYQDIKAKQYFASCFLWV
jgi:hypothetical protein